MKKNKSQRSYPRKQRYFSEDFRRSRVKEYDSGDTSVSEICRAYGVSKSAVYKWIKKYSANYKQGIIQVVESKSETKKRLILAEKVTHLEQMIGQQQVQIQYYEQLLKLLKERYEIDFEKNFDGKFSTGFLQIDPNIK